MAKIVFLNPPLTVEERYGVKSQSGGQTPPLGLTCLAAMARKNGFDTAILDAAALNLNCGEAAREIIKLKPDYLGVTGATIAIDNGVDVVRLVRESLKDVVVIAGGPHFTALPEKTMERFLEFDIGCIGEADITIVEMLNALEAGADLSQVNGLVLRKEGEVYFTPGRQRIKDLDELPMPAWDLLPDLTKYYCPPVHTLKKIPAALLITSRGCPGQCTFCDRSTFGNRCTTNSAGYVIRMVENLYHNYGIKEIQFRDDNFVAFRRRLKEICQKIKDSRLPIVWSCTGRADMVTPELLREMKDAGCWQIWYGVESGSQRILDVINKKITLEQMENAINWTHRVGIDACAFFMIGHPTETKKTIEETIAFSLKLPIKEAHFAFVTPFPGTELFKRVSEYGTFDYNFDWRRLNGWRPLFVPYGLTALDLEKGAKKAFRKFYFRPKIVVGYFKKLKSINHLKIYMSGFRALLQYLIRKNR